MAPKSLSESVLYELLRSPRKPHTLSRLVSMLKGRFSAMTPTDVVVVLAAYPTSVMKRDG